MEQATTTKPTRKMRVCCMGAGHVGGSTMTVLAAHCPDVDVVVVDINEAKIAKWQSGSELPIYEPGLLPLVTAQLNKNLFFTTDATEAIAEADMVFVCVDTPTKLSGLGAGSASDTCHYELCARTIAQAAQTDKVVVEMSTVPVRTAECIKEVLAANAQPNVRFELISNPSFLSEGSTLEDLRNPDRILIGGDYTAPGQAAVEKLCWLYTHWVPRERIFTTSVWSSELTKLVSNALLAQRISSINSISAICEATGANVQEVARAVGADDRIGDKFLNASIGFGGSFQKDLLNLVYLAQTLNLPHVATYWRNVVKINEFQKDRFVRLMVRMMYNTLANKKICLYGFAYKKNTGDARETVAGAIIKALLVERALVVVYDPYVEEQRMKEELRRQGVDIDGAKGQLQFSNDPYSAATDAHAFAVLTAWQQVEELDFDRIYSKMMKPAFFFDGRNVLPHQALKNMGAQVYAVGQSM